jgi:hypothetical protein
MSGTPSPFDPGGRVAVVTGGNGGYSIFQGSRIEAVYRRPDPRRAARRARTAAPARRRFPERADHSLRQSARRLNNPPHDPYEPDNAGIRSTRRARRTGRLRVEESAADEPLAS